MNKFISLKKNRREKVASAQTITWVLSNNVPTEVTREELSEALVLAGAEQSRLWVGL